MAENQPIEPASPSRTIVEVTRSEAATGTLWLSDGTRIFYSVTAGPVISRAEGGPLDDNGLPAYEINWMIQAKTKPARSK